ncbi:hypothetical protein HK097_001402 [Rhizophlyctis rosea]|uniref:Glycosyl transferase family 1 domain-containing protein n=1 Tax=Rhizophlyctis rosea TaxID=64517 RepID=A0AAD5X1D0_9FUNG|nr:hypothetical protein HK097_001402 [Rhizophlyctis rosea]
MATATISKCIPTFMEPKRRTTVRLHLKSADPVKSAVQSKADAFTSTLQAAPLPREFTQSPLKVFYIQSAHGLYASSGGYRANMSLARALLSNGHTVKMLAFVYHHELESIPHTEDTPLHFLPNTPCRVYRFHYNDMSFVALNVDDYRAVFKRHDVIIAESGYLEGIQTEFDEAFRVREEFIRREVRDHGPSHVIMNDPASLKATLDGEEKLAVTRIFIVHDCENLPFGPFQPRCIWKELSDKPYQERPSWQRLRDVEGLWAVSDAVRNYFIKHGSLSPKSLPNHPLIYGDDVESLPYYNNYTAEYITAINPGIHKGFPIVHALARRLPHQKFLIVASWSTTQHVLSQFRQLPNVTIIPPQKNIDTLFSKTRILLVPSLWLEAFGLVVVEALLRGIPVISSDAGGLPEAHLYVPYIVPVNKFTGEREENPELIDKWMVDYKVPEQGEDVLSGWEGAMRELEDQERYEEVRVLGRQKAVEYVKGIEWEGYEGWMRDCSEKNREQVAQMA